MPALIPGKRVLLVEPERTHGQVLIPLARDLLDLGCRVHLALRQTHVDCQTLETMSSSVPEFTMELQKFESNRRLLPWVLRTSLRKWDAVIVMTVKPRRWFVPFLLSLRHRRVSMFVHNIDWFPSPATRSAGRTGALLISSLLHRFLVLSRGVAQCFGPQIPPWLRGRLGLYPPLPGRDISQAPREDTPVFVVPGALEPQRRNYAGLLDTLRRLPPDFPGQVRLVGSLHRSDPELLRGFEELDSVDLRLAEWHSYDSLLHQASQAHFVLPLLDGVGFKSYNLHSASSAMLLADGLARPLLIGDELQLDESSRSCCLRYGTNGFMGEVLMEACRYVLNGTWAGLHQQALKRRLELRRQALNTLIPVCGLSTSASGTDDRTSIPGGPPPGPVDGQLGFKWKA